MQRSAKLRTSKIENKRGSMIWRFSPVSAVPLFAIVVALASFLSELAEKESWTVAFSAWIYRRWEAISLLVGVTAAIGLAFCRIEKIVAKK